MDQYVHPRPRVGFIGAGRVARVLAMASRSAGFDVAAPWARSGASRAALATQLGIPEARTLHDAIDRCGIVVIAVPDSQLSSVLDDLARSLEPAAAPLVVVTSGSAELDGAATGDDRLVRIHPLHPFTNTTTSADLAGVVAAVSARSSRDLDEAERFARALGLEPFRLDDRHAASWHAAGTLAAGGVTTLLAIARDLAVAAGLDEVHALRAMGALAHAAIGNAMDSSPESALTGPVARGDVGTVEQHLVALTDASPATAAAYRAVSGATLELAHRAGRLEGDAARGLDAVLAHAPAGAGR